MLSHCVRQYRRIIFNTVSKRYISKGDFDFTDETPTKDKLVNENRKDVSNENYSPVAPIKNKGTTLLNKQHQLKTFKNDDEKYLKKGEIAKEEAEKYTDDFSQESSFDYNDKERRGWERQKGNE